MKQRMSVGYDPDERMVTVCLPGQPQRYKRLDEGESPRSFLEKVADAMVRFQHFKEDDRLRFLGLCEASFSAKGIEWER